MEDHPLGTVVVVGLGLLAAVGAGIAGAREVVDLVDGSPAPPVREPDPVRLRPSELATATNGRYRFAFQYPVTWERRDPFNGDGLTAIGPREGLEVSASASMRTLGPTDDPLARLDYLRTSYAEATGARVVSGPTQQNVTQLLPGGERGEIPGARFVVVARPDGGLPALKTLVLVTTTPDRDVTMRCQVPADAYPRYEGACNQLLATLTLAG